MNAWTLVVFWARASFALNLSILSTVSFIAGRQTVLPAPLRACLLAVFALAGLWSLRIAMSIVKMIRER